MSSAYGSPPVERSFWRRRVLAALPRSRWESLHLLRAIAAGAVVAHHIPQFLEPRASFEVAAFEAGASGVDVFFVISGFVMYCATALRQETWHGFLAKRAIRVLPMYMVVTIAVTAAVWCVPSAFARFGVTPEQLLKSLAFVPQYDSHGSIRPVIAVGWTLHFELMFYALVALALTWSPRRAGLWAAAAVLAAVGGASLLGLPRPFSAWQLLAPIAIEFALGVALAHALHTLPWLHLPLSFRLAVGSVALLLGGYLLLGLTPHGLGLERLRVWGTGAFSVVMALAWLEPELGRMRSFQRCYRGLGDASYSLYLIHGSVFPIVWKLLPHVVQSSPLGAWTVLMAAPLLACWPTHALIECRLTRFFSGLRRRERARVAVAHGGARLEPYGD